MTKDFIDELIEVVEVKKTVKKSSKDYQATKAKTFEVAGVQVEGKYIPSEETRRKISEGNKGKVLSEETRKKLSKISKGKVVSQETRKKVSEANKGKRRTEEQRRRMSDVRKLRSRSITVMTPNGEFNSRRALIKRLYDDGVRYPFIKLREWFKLYPNDYYYIEKKRLTKD